MSATGLKFKWECPKCGAKPNTHGNGGKKSCQYDGHGVCNGFLCECTGDADMHSYAAPCPDANCYHCGWGGTFPVPPKSALPWEKKALEAGWTPPVAGARELSAQRRKR